MSRTASLRAVCSALALLTLLARSHHLHAERVILKSYSTADGLAHDTVKRVVSDERGLWFCTGEGLSRFDGSGFTTYGVDDGLPSAIVNDIVATPDGRYWIATGAGLVRFDPNTPAGASTGAFSIHLPGAEAQARFVTTLLLDRNGTLWVGTQRGLFTLAAASQQAAHLNQVELRLPHRAIGRTITALMEDRHGMLWIGTMHGLYRRSADGSIEPVALSPEADAWPIHALLQHRNGQVWIGTRHSGLFVVAPDGSSRRVAIARVYSASDSLPTNWISAIVQSVDGVVWVGTNRGLVRFASSAPTSQDQPRVFSGSQGIDREVWAIAEDRQHNLWLGMSHGGVHKLSHRGLTRFDAADGVAWANSIATSRNGELVVVGGPDTSRWALYRFDGSSFHSSRPPPAGLLPGWGWSNTVLHSRTGDWWIGTDRGLYRFASIDNIDDVQWRKPTAVYTTGDGLPAIVVLRLFEDSDGGIWISTVGEGTGVHGLSRWNHRTRTLTHYGEASGLPPLAEYYAVSFAEDGERHVWVGFSGLGGLARLRNGRFTRFSAADGVPAGRISNLVVDRSGRLWAATDRAGIARVDTPGADRPVFTVYSTRDGLSSNAANALVEDLSGRMYLATGRGIDRLDPSTGKVRHYSSADGVPTNATSAVRDRDGALWFNAPGPGGLVRLLPGVDPPRVPPAIVITKVQVSGRAQSISAVGTQTAPALTLPRGNAQLVIDFVAPAFRTGDDLRYQYRLDGADADWSRPSIQRTVHFAYLAPGSYRFAVRAVTTDGIASEAPATLAFTVPSPIWSRWWFVLLVMAATAAGAYAWHRARITRLLAVAQMRSGIATDLHDDIGANLTRIAILSEVARQQAGTGAAATATLGSIGRIARDSVNGMSDIVWAINPDCDTLADLVRKMREHVEEVFAARNLAVAFNAPVEEGPLKLNSAVRRDLYLVFKEAVNNAARHSGCSAIAVDLVLDDGHLSLAVTDNGVGFPSTREHDGNGLVSMRRRAARLGTTLEMDSESGTGTTVRLMLKMSGRHPT